MSKPKESTPAPPPLTVEGLVHDIGVYRRHNVNIESQLAQVQENLDKNVRLLGRIIEQSGGSLSVVGVNKMPDSPIQLDADYDESTDTLTLKIRDEAAPAAE